MATTRPIAPLSTATVTSQRPTLRWALGPGADGARVELCADRACASVLETIDASGASARPTSELPRGVVYWRLFPRSGGATATEPGPTWQFHVGARSAAVDSSWGTTLDVNGDGFGDLAVGAPFSGNTGHVYVYLGSAVGLASTPAADLTDAEPQSDYARAVASAGDVNGDGFADLAVGAPATSSYEGRVYVHLGSAAGLATSAAITLVGPGGRNTQFGVALASAGDVNGDGYADLAVGAPVGLAIGDPGPPRAYVYLGSASGLPTSPATTLRAAGDALYTYFGAALASVGDVDGDGYADLAVGAYQADDIQRGRVDVFRGGAGGLETTPATTLTGSDPNVEFGGVVASAGDVNGDGFADLAVGLTGTAMFRAWLYAGSAFGLATTPTNGFIDPDGGVARNGFGVSIAGVGDLDGDGYADLAIGSPDNGDGRGVARAHVYRGGAAGLDASMPASITGPAGAEGFGLPVAGAGDVDGDGFDDLAVGAPWSSMPQVLVYRGSASGFGAAPETTLASPGASGSAFGMAID